MITPGKFVTIRFDGRHTQTRKFITKSELDEMFRLEAEKEALKKKFNKDKTLVPTEEEKEVMRKGVKVDTYKLISDASDIGKNIDGKDTGFTFMLKIPYNGGTESLAEILKVEDAIIIEESTIE